MRYVVHILCVRNSPKGRPDIVYWQRYHDEDKLGHGSGCQSVSIQMCESNYRLNWLSRPSSSSCAVLRHAVVSIRFCEWKPCQESKVLVDAPERAHFFNKIMTSMIGQSWSLLFCAGQCVSLVSVVSERELPWPKRACWYVKMPNCLDLSSSTGGVVVKA